MQQINHRLNLNTGDALLKLQKLAVDSALVKDSWGGLPSDVRVAQQEMLRLGQQQIRMGFLRKQERLSMTQYQDHVERHLESVGRQIERLRSTTQGHPELERYMSLQASGGLASAVRGDAGLAELHASMRDLKRLEGQQGAIGKTQGLLGRYGIHGNATPGAAFRHFLGELGGQGPGNPSGRSWADWAKSSLFGIDHEGNPNTFGGWAKQSVFRGARRLRGGARSLAGVFGTLDPMQMMRTSMGDYEASAQAVQDLGARLDAPFANVADRIKLLRSEWKYTRAELMPGLLQVARLLGAGGSGQTPGALDFARATGLHPSQALGQFAQMGVYGQVNPYFVEKAMSAAGMLDRPEAFLDLVSAAQGTLGRGFYSVPQGMAARYGAFVGNALGDAYRGPRGADFAQRFIGGAQQDGGSPMRRALRLSAIMNTGTYNLGGGVKADTSNIWGAEMALRSGHPEVINRLMERSVAYGGGDPNLAKYSMLNMFPGTRMTEIDRMHQAWREGRGVIPPTSAIEAHPDLGARRTRVMDPKANPAFRHAQLRAELEGIYEDIGAKLVPTAKDIKDASQSILRGLEAFGQAMAAGQGLSAALGAARPYMEHARGVTLDGQGEGGWLTKLVSELDFAGKFDSLIGWAGGRVAVDVLTRPGTSLPSNGPGPNVPAETEAWRNGARR